MSISLKNHEDRITRLEQNIGSSTGDTGWIDGVRYSNFNYNHEVLTLGKILRYRVKNGVCYLQLSGYADTSTRLIGKFNNWSYGSLNFSSSGFGDRGGSYESKIISVNSNGDVLMNQAYQSAVFPFTSSSCPLNK